MTRDLRALIAPQSIAIIGASADPGRVGGMALQLLLQHRYCGKIFPVNAKYQEISGLRCYASIEQVPDPIDLVVVSVSAPQVVPQLQRCAAHGIRAAVVYAAGFAETGLEAGRRLQEGLVAFAASTGMLVAGPNCMGLANLVTHAYTAFASVFRVIEPAATPGSIALLTQSGNIATAIYSSARRAGANFNYVLNTGNEACLEFSDYLEYLAEDGATAAVAGYVEGLRDGRRFLELAARFRDQRRPLMLLKTGDSAKGAEAAASHTAAMAGSRELYHAAFSQTNVIRAEDITHLADLCYLSPYVQKRVRSGRRVGIVTISGAMGAMLSDQFAQQGMLIPTLAQSLQQILRSGIPDYGMVSNPVDITGSIINQDEFFLRAMQAMLECHELDCVVVYAPGYLLDRLTPAILQIAPQTDKLIVAIDNATLAPRESLESAGVPVFHDTMRAVKAMSSFGKWRVRADATSHWAPPERIRQGTSTSAAAARIGGFGQRTVLTEVEGKAFLKSCGIAIVAEQAISSRAEVAGVTEALGFPVVAKVLSRDIAHKTEIGGVKMNLNSIGEVAAAFDEITATAIRQRPDARIEGCVIQSQVKDGVELLVGVVRDPVFGLSMTVGSGGILTELLSDVTHRLLPVDRATATEMLEELRTLPLLQGFRGAAPRDIAAASEIIAQISAAALELGDELEELEINPLIVRAAGQGAVVVDCLISFGGSRPLPRERGASII